MSNIVAMDFLTYLPNILLAVYLILLSVFIHSRMFLVLSLFLYMTFHHSYGVFVAAYGPSVDQSINMHLGHGALPSIVGISFICLVKLISVLRYRASLT